MEKTNKINSQTQLKTFDPQNWPLNVQVAFEPWAIIPCCRILTYLISRKGSPIYSARGIAKIISCSLNPTVRGLALLVKHGYLTKVGGCYYINSAIEEEDQSSQMKIDRSEIRSNVPNSDQKRSEIRSESDLNSDHNNNKEIIIKNKEEEDDSSEDSPSLPNKKLNLSEKALIGYPPQSDKDKLPEALQELFKSQGKIENFHNVWITRAQWDRLASNWPIDELNNAMRQMAEWSNNLDVSIKTKVPGWKSYRMKRDHARTMDNLLKRKEGL